MTFNWNVFDMNKNDQIWGPIVSESTLSYVIERGIKKISADTISGWKPLMLTRNRPPVKPLLPRPFFRFFWTFGLFLWQRLSFFFMFLWTFGCAGNALMCVFMGSAKASETWYASATHKLCNENTRFNLGFIFVAQSFILNILGVRVFKMHMFSIQKNRRWWGDLGNDDIFLIGNLTCDTTIVTTAVLNLASRGIGI